ncbi:MAG: iron dicitrate transport regulator FecR [Burkholderiaceae bacterium]
MSRHILVDRSEKEIAWFQRRDFLSAAAAWTAMGGFSAAQAQSRSNVIELQGDALLNGQRLLPVHTIQSGDQIVTGPDTTLVFVVGNTAFKVRQNTQMAVERGTSINAVSVLRLLAGAVASVWGRGDLRQIVTPTLTAGIRGTGVYTEVSAKDNGRSYFCTCYGTVDLVAGRERVTAQTEYHQAYWAEPQPRQGRMLTAAGAINHTDEEIEMLARLVGQQTAWQISGKKGVRDGHGYMQK